MPQGVAVTGNTAWISGFRFRKGIGQRPCQMVRVNLATGRRLAFHSSIYGRVGTRPRTYCRHGGGIIRRGKWLWIVEKNKLWQVDPGARGRSVTAHRVWRLKSPVRGSSVVAKAHRIGLVPFKTSGVTADLLVLLQPLMRRGMRDLAVDSNGTKQIGAVESTRIPRYVQGADLRPVQAALPGPVQPLLRRAGLAIRPAASPSCPAPRGSSSRSGRRLWTVSESGAWPYSKSRKPLTPALSTLRVATLAPKQARAELQLSRALRLPQNRTNPKAVSQRITCDTNPSHRM